MAPGNRPDLDRLTTAVDALGTAFATLEIETFTRDTLKQACLEVARASNMIEGIRADLAKKERDLRPPPGTPAPPPARSLDPKGHRPSRQTERDSSRADLFDQLPDIGDATRRGDLSGAYADTVNQAVNRLDTTERAAFYRRYRVALTQKALTSGLHEFRVYVRELVDDFDRARQLDRFRQQRANRSGSIWTDQLTGMTHLFAKFDPETGARIQHAINEEIDRLYRTKRDDPGDTRTHQQLVADAIANLILGARTTGTSSTDLVVLIDLHTLLNDDAHGAATAGTTDTASAHNAASPEAAASSDPDSDETNPTTDHVPPQPAPPPPDPGVTTGAATTYSDGDAASPAAVHDANPTGPAPPTTNAADPPPPATPGRCCETSDGTQLPIETVRRLACNAGIIPAVLNGNGVILDFGRTRRLASPEQRQLLRAMYPTCAFNHCTIPFDRCEIHHIDPFNGPTQGPTDIDKLVPACQHHHHHVHDNHLQLTLDPATRTITATHPDGHTETHPYHDRRRPTADPGTFRNTG